MKKHTGPGQKKKPSVIEEPLVAYGGAVKLRPLAYQEFKKVADRAGFTQTEWSDILHISERTLQRYAKDNHVFPPGNAERFSLVSKALNVAESVFGKKETLYTWLKREPQTVTGKLSMRSLTSFEGIQQVLDQLGRIQHGMFA